jgi:hypothetical protein
MHLELIRISSNINNSMLSYYADKKSLVLHSEIFSFLSFLFIYIKSVLVFVLYINRTRWMLIFEKYSLALLSKSIPVHYMCHVSVSKNILFISSLNDKLEVPSRVDLKLRLWHF